MSKIKGNVKWFNEPKGFGFITPEDGSKACSYTSPPSRVMASKPWLKVSALEFEITNGAKGPSAADVTAI